MLEFSEKQKNVWKKTVGGTYGGTFECHKWYKPLHRWNISSGAVRSGKTFLDFWRIPYRLRNAPNDGIIVLLGNTRGTLERNVLEPMRRIWGEEWVGNINSENKVSLFGRDCWAIGADRVMQAEKLQGASVSYCYGDEITTWNEQVFQTLKARLDKPWSCFDGTCNPDNPNHWLKKFLDSDVDICESTFVIDDNPFLSSKFVDNIKREYANTVYYDRYILGKWTIAEGLIYRYFVEHKDELIDDGNRDYQKILIGVDWGDSSSKHAFVCVGITRGFGQLIALESETHAAHGLTPADIDERLCGFVSKIGFKYGDIDGIFCDHVNTLINGCRAALRKAGLDTNIMRANKISINERILTTCRLMSTGRFRITLGCCSLIDSFNTAVWNSAKPDCRLDDGSVDVDTLDAFEYAWSKYAYCFIR